jgi:hypothetical protein
LYAGLLRFYPVRFRWLFEDEMLAVWKDIVTEARADSRITLLNVCLRELGEWPKNVLIEHWFNVCSRFREVAMGEAGQEGVLPGMLPIGGGWLANLAAATTERSAMVKRVFDLTFALFWLIVAAPLMLLIAVLIKLDSPGPALFRQKRVGKDDQVFTLLKFRSMVDDATGRSARENRGWTRDPRITRMGHLIRPLYLDELPQLLNVLKGEMSVLGPRPGLPK